MSWQRLNILCICTRGFWLTQMENNRPQCCMFMRGVSCHCAFVRIHCTLRFYEVLISQKLFIWFEFPHPFLHPLFNPLSNKHHLTSRSLTTSWDTNNPSFHIVLCPLVCVSTSLILIRGPDGPSCALECGSRMLSEFGFECLHVFFFRSVVFAVNLTVICICMGTQSSPHYEAYTI